MPDHETGKKAMGVSAAEKHRRYLFPCATTYYEQPLTLVRREGDETAVLLARVHTGVQEIIVLRYGYSGRSMMAMAASGQAPWKQAGNPVAGFVHAVAPYCYR